MVAVKGYTRGRFWMFGIILFLAGFSTSIHAGDASQLWFDAVKNRDTKTVAFFLKEGWNVDTEDKDGMTALGFAAVAGDLELSKLLVGHGAKVGHRSLRYYKGDIVTPYWSPIVTASSDGKTDLLRLFLEKVEYGSSDFEMQKALIMAAGDGKIESVKLLLEKGIAASSRFSEGLSALHMASREGNVEIVRLLLDKGALVDPQDVNQDTPLIAVCYSGKLEVVKLLVEAGADVNATNWSGRTPLMCAAAYGHTEVVRFLLTNGAFVDEKNRYGETAGIIAFKNGHKEVVTLINEYKKMT